MKFSGVKKVAAISCVTGAALLSTYMYVDYSGSSREVIELNSSIRSSTKSKEDFYFEYIDTQSKNNNNEEDVTSSVLNNTGQNGGSGASLTNVDTSSWYANVGVHSANREVYETLIESDGTTPALCVYNGPPWDTTSDTYFINYTLAREDNYKLICSATGLSMPSIGSGVCSSPVSGKGGQWKNPVWLNGTQVHVLDGVTCAGFGPFPVAIDKSYFSGAGLWTKRSCPEASLYGYGTRKYCAVVVKKGEDTGNQSNWKYVPLSAQDAKAHTYPGGVSQTNCKVLSDGEVQVTSSNSGYSGNTSIKGDLSSNAMIKQVNDTLVSASGNNLTSWSWCAIESYNWSKELVNKFKEFTVVGFLAW